jgi:hypothetical protein
MVAVETLLIAAALTFVVVWLAYYAAVGDGKEAASRTRGKALGLGTGIAGMATAVLQLGLDVVAQLPEIAITLVGIGALLQGWSWEAFAAVALVTWIVAEGLNGGPRGA